MPQDVQFIANWGKLPEGFCPKSYQDLMDAMMSRLSITPNQNYSTFVVGSTEPTTNQGPWLKDGVTWYIWSDADGKYIPMLFPSIASIAIGTILPWGGAIADIATYFGSNWKFCNGDALSRLDFATLFSIIGIQYGPGDGVTTFNIPDTRDQMWAMAKEDDAGTAKTTMGDGATLIKSRVYTSHTHSLPIFNLPQDGTNPGNYHLSSGTSGNESVRSLPPLIAFPAVIRVI